MFGARASIRRGASTPVGNIFTRARSSVREAYFKLEVFNNLLRVEGGVTAEVGAWKDPKVPSNSGGAHMARDWAAQS